MGREQLPPKRALQFLNWFCKEDYLEEIEGNLIELYEQKQETQARFLSYWFYWQVILHFQPAFIKSFSNNSEITTDMLKNYFKIALRQMWNQKLYSSIKIGGFAVGIAAFVLLFIYLKHEWSFDAHYLNKDRIYRVTTRYLKEGFRGVDYPAPFSKALKEDFPEVEKSGRLIPAKWLNQLRLEKRFQNNYEDGFAYVDAELLDILDIPMIYGEYNQSMQEPNTLILSKSKADVYFPNQDPVNKNVFINNNKEQPYKVVGVYEDFPTNGHLQFDFLISLEGVEFWPGEQTYWGANMYDVYALLHAGVEIPPLNTKLSSLTTNYFLPSWIEREFVNPQEIADNIGYELQPIQNIYLDSANMRDGLPHGDKGLLWLFALSSLLIILIAAINFINLTIARFSIRLKEISMRKIIGATKNQIVHQFLTESVLYSFFSFLIGALLAWYLLPVFNQFLGKSLSFPWGWGNGLFIFFTAILLLGGLIGLYPSFYLSSLKALLPNGQSRRTWRNKSIAKNMLVVFQFTVSAVLIICTLVVYQQMSFILNKDLGFDKDQVLTIQGAGGLGEKLPVFKEELLQLRAVKKVSVSDYLPVEGSLRYQDSFWEEGKQTNEQGLNAQIWQVDPDYIETLGLNLLSGRGFSKDLASDSSAIIISKSLAENFSFENDINGIITNKSKSWKIIGVIDDFHFESLKTSISPTCLVLGNSSSTISVKLSSSNFDQEIPVIKEIWNSFKPDTPFRYAFLDDSFAAMHEDVHRSAYLFNSFALLAIFIACIGLFGLTAFMSQQRSKEIGIRKVFGATVGNIVRILSIDFLKLVFIAIIIAIPIGWYIMDYWLDNFAYRIDISWWVFVIAATITFLVALGTSSIHSIKSALLNPVEAIRN